MRDQRAAHGALVEFPGTRPGRDVADRGGPCAPSWTMGPTPRSRHHSGSATAMGQAGFLLFAACYDELEPAVEVPGRSVPQYGWDETSVNPDLAACSTQVQVLAGSFPKSLV